MAKTLKRSHHKRKHSKRTHHKRKHTQHKRKHTQHKRKHSKRTHKRRQRGGSAGFLGALQKAVLPFLFYKAQKTQQRRVIRQRKLKRSNKNKKH